MENDHYHLIYFAGDTAYATLKLGRDDAIDAVSRYMANIYGNAFDGGLDQEMYSQLQLKMYTFDLDNMLLMERDDPLTVGIKRCDDDECVNAPIMN